jgi:hypothetical protein
MSVGLELLRLELYAGIMLPQAQRAVQDFFWIFVDVAGIIFVIFGLFNKIPCGCCII